GRFGSLIGQVPIGALVKPGAIAVEAPHAVFGAGFEGGSDFEEVAVADEVSDGVGGGENLAFRHANFQVFPKVEAVGDYFRKAVGKLGSDAVLDFGRERADDALQGFGAS